MSIKENIIIEKIKINLLLYGIKGFILRTFKYIIRHLFKFSWEKCYLMSFRINENSVFEFDEKDIVIKKLGLSDFEDSEWATFFSEEKRATYEARLSNDKTEAYGVFVKNRLAFSSWLLYDNIEVQGMLIKGDFDNTALFYDSYCHPAFRRRGLHILMTNWRLYHVRTKNVNKCYVVVYSYNKPSIKTQKRCGFIIESSFYLFRYKNKKYCTLDMNKKKSIQCKYL